MLAGSVLAACAGSGPEPASRWRTSRVRRGRVRPPTASRSSSLCTWPARRRTCGASTTSPCRGTPTGACMPRWTPWSTATGASSTWTTSFPAPSARTATTSRPDTPEIIRAFEWMAALQTRHARIDRRHRAARQPQAANSGVDLYQVHRLGGGDEAARQAGPRRAGWRGRAAATRAGRRARCPAPPGRPPPTSASARPPRGSRRHQARRGPRSGAARRTGPGARARPGWCPPSRPSCRTETGAPRSNRKWRGCSGSTRTKPGWSDGSQAKPPWSVAPPAGSAQRTR